MEERIENARMQELVTTYREARDAAARAETALFDYFWRPLLAFVKSITDGEGATDQAQSTARRFLASLDRALPNNSKAYLFQTARNRVRENGRRQRPVAIPPDRIDELRGDESPVLDQVMVNEIMDNLAEKNGELIGSMSGRDPEIIRDWLSTANARQTADRIECSEAEVDRAVTRYKKLILRWLFS